MMVKMGEKVIFWFFFIRIELEDREVKLGRERV